MNLPTELVSGLPWWHAALVFGPTLAAALAAAAAGPGSTRDAAWRGARWAGFLALACAGLSLAAVLAGSRGAGLGMRADAVGGVMLLLVSFVGCVIVRYSQTYLNGEHEERHYARWLMATLAAVSLVVATNHLLMLVLAWTATSLALHRLLVFFDDRPPAVVAAHKKFIVGRAADLCMIAAAALLFAAFGTWHIDELAARAAAGSQLPWTAQAAALLIVCAALLKCAQLPFHGWLIQVMEAPTPVSALLHAGVVNLGGFVLMRFASLLAEVPAAQTLLVVAGTATAVLAALVMTTRISVKVMLAWSTCAQMGFMLMQCGLGVWDMALLHLVAHSLYKAHAFLGAGGVVRRTQLVRMTPPAQPGSSAAVLVGALLAVGMTAAAAALVAWLVPGLSLSPAIGVLAAIVALALVPLLQASAWRLGGAWPLALSAGAFAVALSYFGLHALLSAWLVPQKVMPAAPVWMGVALAFGALFVLQSLITLFPRGALARRLYPWFYGGLFLDEAFNRVAFALWRPPATAASTTPLPAAESQAAIDPATPATAGARA